MPTVQQQRDKLVSLLKELFQLDQPDLDFGFYRIMHAKAKQVTAFLENDLLKIVEQTFGQASGEKLATLQKAYEDAIAQAKSFGAPDPEQSDPVKKAKAALEAAKDTSREEGEVYEHLYRFFERYYDGGDFMTRRYLSRETPTKAAVFAVPYDGSESHFHWANNDQYYIKTAEYFTAFSFDPMKAPEVESRSALLFPNAQLPALRVHFRIVSVTEGEHGNIKPRDDAKRFFLLRAADPVVIENGELVCHFHYRPDPDKTGQETTWQAKRNEQAVARVFESLGSLADPRAKEYLAVLKTPAPTDKQKDRPILARYLAQYTGRNTTDYFIHKKLGSFLSRELDFYLKNEVMRLDDIEEAEAPKAASYLDQLRCLRHIGGKITVFLTQLEEFQKKLWLKKKFVTECHYCITLDRVPESFYPEVASNEAQRQDWLELFAIDEIKGDLVVPAYSVPLTPAFLKANEKLVLDTRHFDDNFIHRLISHLDNLDAGTDGALIHSDNFQALRLVAPRYHDQAKCIYIDPPYNTASSSIPYKNDYRHSSWGTMMLDRLRALSPTLRQDGAIFVSIDKAERTMLEHAMDGVFGQENRIEELVWAMNTNNSQAPNYSTNHEFVQVYAKNRQVAEGDRGMFREPKPGFEEVMALVDQLNPSFPTVAQVESELKALYERHKVEFRDELESQGLEYEDEKSNDPWKGLYNYKRAEYRDGEGRFVAEQEASKTNARIWVWREDNISMPAAKQAASTRDPNHQNWRFYRPPHPVTGKPCGHPKSGWKFAYADNADSPERRSFVALDRDSRIVWGTDETKMPQLKRFLHEVETNVSKSVFQDYSDGEKQTSAMFGKSGLFLAPKHADFVSRFVLQAGGADSTVIDCFGGSGSTAHAVIKLNRDDRGTRKYLLAEANTYFDTVLKPRVMKAVYSSHWRSGKPISREGISHCIKYLRLESYEDCLNNLELKDDAERRKQLEQNPGLREDYMLHYMLDVETGGSASLLNIDLFKDPTAYKLKVKKPGSDEYDWKNVDLLETFNYLLGLRVEHLAAPQTFAVEFEREVDPDLPKGQLGRLKVKGKLKQAAEPPEGGGKWWFRKVEGWVPRNPATPNDGQREKVLIVWRKLTGDIEQDNLVLDEWFRKYQINPRESYDYDTIYVNGSNNLPNLKLDQETWRVRLIEEDFHRLMWDTDEA